MHIYIVYLSPRTYIENGCAALSFLWEASALSFLWEASEGKRDHENR